MRESDGEFRAALFDAAVDDVACERVVHDSVHVINEVVVSGAVNFLQIFLDRCVIERACFLVPQTLDVLQFVKLVLQFCCPVGHLQVMYCNYK